MRLPRLFIAFLLLALAPAAARAQPPVWVVHDKDSTVVLFGSVHLLPSGLDWRPKALKDALANADDIWFEAPMDQAGQVAATTAASAKALLPAGQRLSPLLSRTGRARLAKAAETLGLPMDELDRLEPWYAELAISNALYGKIGIQREDGVELQLWDGANPGAARHAFETPAQQVGFFADAPIPDQVSSLELTLKDLAGAEHDYQVVLNAWMGADLRTLDREVLRPLRRSSPRLYATVVKQRNARWAAAIDQRLKGSGHTVVVVGMGHLVGRDGLPALLRARGYEVDGPRPDRPEPKEPFMAYDTLIVERIEAVELIRLNRPEALNALNDRLMDELTSALDIAEADDAVRAIVITGSERAFAAGADIKEMASKDYVQTYSEDFITRNWERVTRCRKPVIAAVSGYALGGGCELAMMCDFILASETAKFGQPEITLGVAPGAGGSQRLTRFVGKSKAMDMILTGRMMDAAEAERSGLVSRVFPKESLLEEALAAAKKIAEQSPLAAKLAKEMVQAAYETTLSQGVKLERRLFQSMFAFADQKEGMAAFIEKRKPDFQGK